MNSKKIIQLSTTQKIMLSFLCAILVGSFLLALPISSATGEAVPYIDALFTATTSICVTGLVTVPTYSTWSVWGQIVILFLIQLGGLGVITVMYGVMMGLHRRLGLGNRWMLQDVFPPQGPHRFSGGGGMRRSFVLDSICAGIRTQRHMDFDF